MNFDLRQDGKATLRVLDLNGRLTYEVEQAVHKGSNTIELQGKNLTGKGVFIYQLLTSEDHYSGKLMRY